MIRPLNQQFDKEEVEQILKLIKKIESLAFPEGACRYYAEALKKNLEAGCLLGSLIVATAILEIFVRNKAIKHCKPKARSDINLETELEGRRHINFRIMVDSLNEAGMFEDSEEAKEIYNNVRTPLQHGLTGRFVDNNNNNVIGWFRRQLKRPASIHDLEEVIEAETVNYVTTIVKIIEKNI